MHAFTMRSNHVRPAYLTFQVGSDRREPQVQSPAKTQQSKFLEGICKGKEYVLELTGTPVVNNNTDLIQQLKIMGRLEDFWGI